MDKFDKIINNLTLNEMIGQVLCFGFHSPKIADSLEKIEEIAKKYKPGAFFTAITNNSDDIKMAREIVEKYTKIPVIVAADVEHGPGASVPGEVSFPYPMAWGACDDPELIEEAHRAMAERCRQIGIHWNFAPVVDINYNMDNPEQNTRTFSDKPEHVARTAVAAVRGMQNNGMMAAGCKHFPGHGLDSRNSHFCTTINTFSKEEWLATYGYVYKELFKAGATSVMTGHVALPAYDEKINDWVGYPPCTVSYNLQTKLLKEELGFEGCVVSDALCMVGACTVIKPDKLAVEFIKTGGDMVLFPEYDDFERIKEAVLSGEIPMDRLKDAVRRVLKMKDKVRLFEEQETVQKDMSCDYDLEKLSDEIAEKSITLIRNYGDTIPLNLKKGDKVVLVNLQKEGNVPQISFSLDVLEEELNKRGFDVYAFRNPNRPEIKEHLKSAAAVLVNIKISPLDYTGGTLRTNWQHIEPLWHGVLLENSNTIFASFGDPYKIFEFPYVKNYVNVYSPVPASQRAYIKAILGEIPIQGKSPVELKDFFEREL